MPQQLINHGTVPNDKTGESAFSAFQKVNENFTELYSAGGGGGVWGGITGALGDQTDLQGALDDKEDAGGAAAAVAAHEAAGDPHAGYLTAAEGNAAYQPLDSDLTTIDASITAAGHAILDDASAAAQRTTLGLGSVDNTSDAAKPVSTATQTALDGKQPLDADLTTIAAANNGAVLAATTEAFLVADGTKLDGIAAGATAGATWGSNVSGQPAVVGQAEAEAGTATTERIWTAERVAQAIAALASGGGGGVSQLIVPFHSAADSNVTLTNQANSEQFLGNSNRNITRVDLSDYTEYRLVARIVTGSASVNTPRLYAQYHTSFTTTAATHSPLGDSGDVNVSLTTAGHVETAWTTLAAGAKADVFLTVLQNGGDAAADPAVAQVVVQFR